MVSASQRRWTGIDTIALLSMVGIALLLRLAFFTGLSGSDDTVYAIRGMETARGLWLPTDYVGDLRYGINLPIAVFVTLFGTNTIGLHAWAMLCSLGEVVVIYLTARHLWDTRAATLAAFAMAVTPLHVHAGGRALADAPLALFITLSFALFLAAEHTRRRSLYWLTGAAIGVTWWIKPHAIMFTAVFGLFALISRSCRREWLLIMFGAASVIGLELAMFGAMFGDPLYALKAMASGVQTNFVRQTAPWGDHAPFYYFRLMFRDGRDMGIVPILATLGLVIVLWRRDSRALRSAGYVAVWCVGLLAVFSFTPYSLSPIRLIPKQDNYALIFFGGVALLAGFGLSAIRPTGLRWAVILMLGTTSLVLSSLGQMQQLNKQQALEVAATYVHDQNAVIAYLPEQAMTLRRAHELMGVVATDRTQRQTLRSLMDGTIRPSPSVGPTLAFLQSGWPEVVQARTFAEAERRLPCMRVIAELPVITKPIGRPIAEALVAASAVLPEFLARQLTFANALLAPPPVVAYRLSPSRCDER